MNKIYDKITSFEFFEWFLVFLVSGSVVLFDYFIPIQLNNYFRLLLYVISTTLLCFWISWILFGFKAIKARGFIFAGVVIVCYICTSL